jgi:rSAM/selenodomain-associated transferase 1
MNRPIRRNRKAPRRNAAPFRWRLVIMAKVPVAGQVKTRLAREIGVSAALQFYRAASRAILARLAADRRWETVLAIAPDAAIHARFWPRRLKKSSQGRGDLGQRMQRILDTAAPGPAIIVGTDVPEIRPSHIAAAFRALGDSDAVLGPAADGGYWLVGARRRPRGLPMFENVRWSSAHTLTDTERNLVGLRIARVATLSDVDDARDLRAAQSRFGRRVLPALTPA